MKDLLSIIIVTYNNSRDIIACIESIKKQIDLEYELIVVDNNSSDMTVEDISRRFPRIKIVRQNKNLGFSAANSIGVNRSQGDFLFFLNPDTKIISKDITSAIAYLTHHSDVGLIGPKLIEPGGEIQPSVRKLPTFIGAFKEYILGQKNSYSPYYPITVEPLEVESLVGGAMLLRKDIYIKAGGFDKNYFMYYEDLDLCRKIRNKGYKVIYFPDWIIEHKIGGSASTNPKVLQYIQSSSLIYHGLWEYFLITVLFQTLRFTRVLYRMIKLFSIK